MGRQHTEQSSTCCCESTERSSAISIGSQQYGQVIVSNWITLGLQPLPVPAARLEDVGVARVELALVADAFVKAVAAFDPELDCLKPQAEAAPEVGPRQTRSSGLGGGDLGGALLERCRVEGADGSARCSTH